MIIGNVSRFYQLFWPPNVATGKKTQNIACSIALSLSRSTAYLKLLWLPNQQFYWDNYVQEWLQRQHYGAFGARAPAELGRSKKELKKNEKILNFPQLWRDYHKRVFLFRFYKFSRKSQFYALAFSAQLFSAFIKVSEEQHKFQMAINN